MITKNHEKTTPTWPYLSIIKYLPLRNQCNKTVNVFMYAIQKPATEKILVKGSKISEHMLLRDNVLYHTIHITREVNHIPMVRNTIFKILQLGSSKNVCSVHCNRIVWCEHSSTTYKISPYVVVGLVVNIKRSILTQALHEVSGPLFYQTREF